MSQWAFPSDVVIKRLDDQIERSRDRLVGGGANTGHTRYRRKNTKDQHIQNLTDFVTLCSESPGSCVKESDTRSFLCETRKPDVSGFLANTNELLLLWRWKSLNYLTIGIRVPSSVLIYRNPDTVAWEHIIPVPDFSICAQVLMRATQKYKKIKKKHAYKMRANRVPLLCLQWKRHLLIMTYC